MEKEGEEEVECSGSQRKTSEGATETGRKKARENPVGLN